MEKVKGAYKYQITVDKEMHEAIEQLIDERGMTKAAACRFLMMIGFDHYKECKALGIIALSDVFKELHYIWADIKKGDRQEANT